MSRAFIQSAISVHLLLFMRERVVGREGDPYQDEAEQKLDSHIDKLGSDLVVAFLGEVKDAESTDGGDNEDADHVEPPHQLDVAIALVIVHVGYGVTY